MIYALDGRTATPHFPGIGRYARALIDTLPELMTSKESGFLLAPPEIQKASGWSVQVPDCGPFSWKQQMAIPSAVAKSGAGLVHSLYFMMPYRWTIPCVLTVYDLIPLLYPQTVSAKARIFFRLANRLALAAADQVIAISETTRLDYMKRFGIPAAKITAVPLAASQEFYPRSSAEKAQICAKYGLPDSFCLYIGSNKPHKNLPALVDAWLQEKTLPVLAVAGPWDDRYPQAKEKVAAAGAGERIRFLKRLPGEDLVVLLSAARVFVFPSLYEGFGLPVLEAMASGTAVICGDTPTLHEVCGQAAIYLDHNHPRGWAEVIGGVLGNVELHQQMTEQGLQQAKKFSWQKNALDTLGIYRKLIQNVL